MLSTFGYIPAAKIEIIFLSSTLFAKKMDKQLI